MSPEKAQTVLLLAQTASVLCNINATNEQRKVLNEIENLLGTEPKQTETSVNAIYDSAEAVAVRGVTGGTEPATDCDCPDCNPERVRSMSASELRATFKNSELMRLLTERTEMPDATMGELRELAEALGLKSIAVVGY